MYKVKIVSKASSFCGHEGFISADGLAAADKDPTIMSEIVIPDFIPTRFYRNEFELVDSEEVGRLACS